MKKNMKEEILRCLIDEVSVEMKPAEMTLEVLKGYESEYAFVKDFLEKYAAVSEKRLDNLF